MSLPELSPWQWVGVGAVVLALVLAGVLGYVSWRRRQAARERLRPLDAIAFDMLRDVLLPDGNDGHIHVDFLLLTASGMVVVDLRDVQGAIFAGESMDEWALMDGPRRRTFGNPLSMLYDRMAAVGHLAGKDVPVDGRVVFTARASFPKGRPRRVTLVEVLAQEFPAADRAASPSPVAAWQEAWSRVREAATPSPVARG